MEAQAGRTQKVKLKKFFVSITDQTRKVSNLRVVKKYPKKSWVRFWIWVFRVFGFWFWSGKS